MRCWQAVLAASPDDGVALAGAAGALLRLGRIDEAVPLAERVVAASGIDTAARTRLGLDLLTARRPVEALALFRSMLRAAPDDPDARLLLASAQMELGDHEAALASLRAVLDARPDFVPALCNAALALLALGRPEEAETACRRAVLVEPNAAKARFQLACILLTMGRMREGWAAYEHRGQGRGQGRGEGRRWSNPAVIATPFAGESVRGRSIFVHGEQGNSDYFQFARYLPLLRERGARAIGFIVPARLKRILSTLPGDIEVVDAITEQRRFDLQCRMMSLPHLSGLDVCPAPTPYLSAEPARAARWRDRVGTQGFRIGVTWAGGQQHGRDFGRSFAPGALAPLARLAGVRLIGLLPGLSQDAVDALSEGVRIESPGAEFDAGPDAFLDAAALMQELDLVVTLDSGLAHLAGALGRPTWVALPFAAEWRWLRGRDDSPWYPGTRLFRQRSPGVWDDVFAEMARLLEARD